LYRFVATFTVTLHAPTATSKKRRSEDPKEAGEGSDGRRQIEASFTARFDGLCWLAGRRPSAGVTSGRGDRENKHPRNLLSVCFRDLLYRSTARSAARQAQVVE